MIKKLLNKRKTITIKYSNLLISDKTTDFTFSLSTVYNKQLLDKHLKDINNPEFILNHKFVLKTPNKVFKLNLSTKEVIVERWWFNKIKNTLFIDSNKDKGLYIESIPFKTIVKQYLSKDY